MTLFSPGLVLFDYEPPKVKTTLEQRLAHKKARRTRNLQKLVDRLKLRVLAGSESQKHIDCVLERISQQGYYPAILDTLRRKQ